MLDHAVDSGWFDRHLVLPEYRDRRRDLGNLFIRSLRIQAAQGASQRGMSLKVISRYSSMRPHLGGFAERGACNTAYQENKPVHGPTTATQERAS